MWPVPHVNRILASAADAPPRPNTEPTALFGKKSLGSVWRLLIQTWKPKSTTAIHASATYGSLARIARMPADVSNAPTIITVFRARLTVHPREMSAPDA